MQPNYLPLVKIFGSDIRHTVPLFQRPYVWNRDEQWEPLWADIAALANRVVGAIPNETIAGHFLGTAVLEQASNSSGTIARREIIDGQQRLTTLQIILHATQHAINAIEDTARKANNVEEANKANVASRQIANLTINPAVGDEEEKYKVWPTNEDRVPFRQVMDAASPSEIADSQSRMAQAYRYFYKSIATWIGVGQDAPARAVKLAAALKDHVRLIILDLDGTDEPQAIFETLNAHGTPLLSADLMKNWFLWEASRQSLNADQLYRSYWHDFDKDHAYWRERIGAGHAARARVDILLQNWLTRRTDETISAKHLYDRFLKFAMPRNEVGALIGTRNVAELMANILEDAKHFRIIEKPSGNTRFDQFLRRTSILDVVVFYPLILELMSRPGSDAQDLDASATIIESYLVRRMICAQQTRGYGDLAISALRALHDRDTPAAPVLDAFLSHQTGALRWPDDQTFKTQWSERSLYGNLRRQRIVMLLSAIEEVYSLGGSKSEPIIKFNFDSLQIEHILPQEWQEHWPLNAIEKPERDALIHTIGNLTLVTSRLNPALSNAPWIAQAGANQKRQGLAEHSRLQLNSRIVKNFPDCWDEAAIRARAAELFEIARGIWQSPNSDYLTPEGRVERQRSQSNSRDQDGDSGTIRILVDTNPKRKGSASHERFQLYRESQTVAEYKAACRLAGYQPHKAAADIRWDVEHNFISIHQFAPDETSTAEGQDN